MRLHQYRPVVALQLLLALPSNPSAVSYLLCSCLAKLCELVYQWRYHRDQKGKLRATLESVFDQS